MCEVYDSKLVGVFSYMENVIRTRCMENVEGGQGPRLWGILLAHVHPLIKVLTQAPAGPAAGARGTDGRGGSGIPEPPGVPAPCSAVHLLLRCGQWARMGGA